MLMLFAGIAAVASFLAGLLSWQAGYEEASYFILSRFGQDSHLEVFRKSYYTSAVHQWSSIALFLAGCFWLSIVVWGSWKRYALYKLISTIRSELITLIRLFLQPWKHFTSKEWTIFMLAFGWILVSRILLSVQMPLHLDEMHTWLHFADHGTLVSISYYPNPNNHVLFSILASWADACWSDPHISLRVLSVSIGLLVCVFVFRFLCSYTSVRWSIAGMLLFGLAPIVQHYGILARGYMLQTLLFAVVLASTLSLLKQSTSRTWGMLLSLSLAASTFTLISFVYTWLGISVFVLLITRQIGKAWSHLRWHLLGAIFTGIAYTPLLLVSGWRSVASHGWILRIVPGEWWDQCLQSYTAHAVYFLNLGEASPFVYPALWVFIGASLYASPHRRFLLLQCCIMLVSTLLCLFQGILPYERMWTLWMLSQQCLLLLAVQKTLDAPLRSERWPNVLSVMLCFFYAAWMLFQPKAKEDIYYHAESDVRQILAHRPDNIFCEEYVYYQYLHMHARLEKCSVNISNEDKTMVPDWYIHDRSLPWPTHLNPDAFVVWKTCDSFVCIYRLKE